MEYYADPCYNDRKPKPKKKREPNLCKKERKIDEPYEIWIGDVDWIRCGMERRVGIPFLIKKYGVEFV